MTPKYSEGDVFICPKRVAKIGNVWEFRGSYEYTIYSYEFEGIRIGWSIECVTENTLTNFYKPCSKDIYDKIDKLFDMAATSAKAIANKELNDDSTIQKR